MDVRRHLGPLFGRARAWRSAMRSRSKLSHQGPKTMTMAAMKSTAPRRGAGRFRSRAPRPR